MLTSTFRPTFSLLLLAVALVAAQALAAEEQPVVPAPAPALDLVQLSVSAGEGFKLNLNPAKSGEPDRLLGGVNITYEAILLDSDSLTVWKSPLIPGGAQEIERLQILPGPKCPANNRVIFDTRDTKLPRVGFRGLLTPASIEVQRQPFDPTKATEINFLARLADLGGFAWQVLAKNGQWIEHRGWADHATLGIQAKLGPRGIEQPIVRSIILYGAEKTAVRPARRAEITRIGQALPAGMAQKAGENTANPHAESMEFTITFLPDGNIDSVSGGKSFTGSDLSDFVLPLSAPVAPATSAAGAGPAAPVDPAKP